MTYKPTLTLPVFGAKALFALVATLGLTACIPASVPQVSRALPIAQTTMPPVKTFPTGLHKAPKISHADFARDFMDLSFNLENGTPLAVFTRFEGPIAVRVQGDIPPSLQYDLSRLLDRLRLEAGIPIRQTNAPTAQITIHSVPRKDIRQVLPQAACFVAPNVTTLREYRKSTRTNWSQLRSRKQIAIFLPSDVSPQEIRDCLHEELAQALGPLNDLYRLPDSVFNDDNVHTVLTGFDMLVLRAYYAPQLRNGMTRGQVAAALPQILDTLNPQDARGPSHSATRTPAEWNRAIERALGASSRRPDRMAGARDALRIAEQLNWQDTRRAFAHYTMGRVLERDQPHMAQRHYAAANRYYQTIPGTDLHRAYVAAQQAGYAITQGDGAQALVHIAPHLETAHLNENAALLATLLLLRAEALELENRPQEAQAVRLDSLGWARYGFGSDWAVRAKLREIATLNPHKG